MILSDTICAPATGRGGAIAIVRMSGPDSLLIADHFFRAVGDGGRLSDAPGYSVHYGDIVMPSVDCAEEILDNAVVTVYKTPHSYTGEDSVEFSVHSSPFIVSKLLELLLSEGARMALPGEFTQRAFIAGKMDLSQAEAVADVISSSSEIEHRIAFNQMRGGYSAKLKSIRNRLLELSSLLELELDFSEEEVEFADRSRLLSLAQEALDECTRLADSFRTGNAIKNGVPVAIIGPPNSGKSTLLNALLGDERAIVSDIPGTTRDTVEDLCVIDGVKFRFIDTAGLRDTSDTVEKMGIERSKVALQKAHTVIGLVDCTSPSLAADASYIASLVSDDQRLIMVYNKVDRVSFESDSVVPESLELSEYQYIRISALTGEGLSDLKNILSSGLVQVEDDSILVTNARHAQALSNAASSLSIFQEGLSSTLPGDLLAEDLRSAIADLNTILGEDLLTPQDTLNNIFGHFCIGK